MCVCVCVCARVCVCVCTRVCVLNCLCVHTLYISTYVCMAQPPTTEGGEGWPSQGQAVISVGGEEEEEDSTLTWAYPHPRVIVSLTTLPVPLGRQTVHTPQALPAVSGSCWYL